MASDSRYYFGGYIQLHDGRYWCRICGMWLGNYDNARIHCATTKAHAWCERCERVFVDENGLENHQIDSDLHNLCWMCEPEKDFDTEQELDDHLDNCHYFCGTCEDYFDTEDDLKDHNIEDHWGCHICGETFTTQAARDGHLRSHGPRDWKCKNCDRDFRRFPHWLAHLELSACGSRDRIRKLAYDVVGYHKFCDGRHNWICHTCGRYFDHLSSLFSHAEDSTGDCSDLLDRGQFLSALKAHLVKRL